MSKIENGTIILTPIERAFYKYLYDMPGYDPKIRECREQFKKAMMADPSVTKESLIAFINEHAPNWSRDRKVANDLYGAPMRDDDY